MLSLKKERLILEETEMKSKPKIGIIPGDPGGIGPEIIIKLLNSKSIKKADILLIGDPHIFELGQKQASAELSLSLCKNLKNDWTNNNNFSLFPRNTIHPNNVSIAKVSKENGLSAISNLKFALDLARDQIIDGILFGPFNKASLIEAGMGFEDELHFIANYLNVKNYISELNTLDGIWTSRVSSHIPLKDVSSFINEERIKEAANLIDKTLKQSGIKRPRLAVAALNPHAGDNGNFGTEEIDIINPTIKKLQMKQINIDGPWPSDTIFLKAKKKEVDGIITMYHDQGQIALKLMGFHKGVTVQGGIPFPVTTPAHGTAFDIVGRGCAQTGAIEAAFNIACDMTLNWGD